jgi:protein-S-isoprenylcysteine O-methyltransferase Ste14
MKRIILFKMAITRLIIGFLVLGIMFFLPAGTLRYWNAWVYIGVLIIPMCIALILLIWKDPDLLERRLRMKEKETQQKTIIRLSWVIFLLAFTIPGFDYRFGWTILPVWVVVCADLVILAGFFLFMWVMRVNSYASRIIEVEKEQKVIDTGPYSVIRHPLYVSNILIYLATPVALGSVWGFVAILPLPVLIIFRILNEEKILKNDLPGYREYQEKIRYRLVPGTW